MAVRAGYPGSVQFTGALRGRMAEVARFGMVGGMAYVVDVGLSFSTLSAPSSH